MEKVGRETPFQSKEGIMQRIEELLDQKLAEVKKEILAVYRAEFGKNYAIQRNPMTGRVIVRPVYN